MIPSFHHRSTQDDDERSVKLDGLSHAPACIHRADPLMRSVHAPVHARQKSFPPVPPPSAVRGGARAAARGERAKAQVPVGSHAMPRQCHAHRAARRPARGDASPCICPHQGSVCSVGMPRAPPVRACEACDARTQQLLLAGASRCWLEPAGYRDGRVMLLQYLLQQTRTLTLVVVLVLTYCS